MRFSEQATIRLRYYDLNLGKEQNLKVIKRPAPGYVWKIVPDQDAPYTQNNLVIARVNDLSQLALTATCGSGEEEESIYFYTNYIYIQNCEPCKCFKEIPSQPPQTENMLSISDEDVTACSEENKKGPGPDLEDTDYTEKTFFEEMRGGTTSYTNKGCNKADLTLYYDNIEAVGGIGEFNLNFEIGDGSCISEISLAREDVDDKVVSRTMDNEGFADWTVLFNKIKGDVGEQGIYSKKIEVGIENTDGACSHERLLINVAGTGIQCGELLEGSIAKCCTEENKADCDWEPAAGATFTGECNKLGFHTLVQDTDDQALIDRHLETVLDFAGQGGWALNLDYQNNLFSPQDYVSQAISLGLRPIIRVERPLNQKPSDAEVTAMASHINSLSGLEYVQFLNEPNIISGFTGAEYASKLKLFHEQVNPNIKIIAGNLAPNQGDPTADTINYIASMFSEDPEGVADAFDIWGSHSYPNQWKDDVQDDTCTGMDCPINSIYAYRQEYAKIKEKLPDFNKPVIITETGYKLSASSESAIATNMVKAFTVWNSDERVIGVTPFILADATGVSGWGDHAWATIPIGGGDVSKTAFFNTVKEFDGTGAVCMSES